MEPAGGPDDVLVDVLYYCTTILLYCCTAALLYCLSWMYHRVAGLPSYFHGK